MWRGVLPTLTEQFSNVNWRSCNSAELWVRSHRLRAQSCKTSHLPYIRSQSQVWTITCISDLLAVFWKFPQPSPWVWLICWSSSQNSETYLLAKSPVYYETIELGKSQREEILRLRSGEGSLVNCTLVSQAPAGKWSHFLSHFTRQSHHRPLPNFKDDDGKCNPAHA